MARKKEKKKGMGFGDEEADEALEAEGLKRTQMDVGRAELVDRDTSTPYIETYDEDRSESQTIDQKRPYRRALKGFRIISKNDENIISVDDWLRFGHLL